MSIGLPVQPIPPSSSQFGSSYGSESPYFGGEGTGGKISINWPTRAMRKPVRAETSNNDMLLYFIIATIIILIVVYLLWMYVAKKKRKRKLKLKFW